MKLWGGRFAKKTDKLVEDFHSSISFDQRLYKQDIMGSVAHAAMLGKQGIISQEEADVLVAGLKTILQDIEAGQVHFEVDAEDIHMNVEKILTERVGEVGKKLHTARSRNDQIALDVRMYLKEEIKEITGLLLHLQEVLLDLADQHVHTVMPGYTHLQKAQPITLAHHLMAYFQMFSRDMDRLHDCYRRTDVMPLGSGALAGTTFQIDREFVKEQLGFAAITANSLDGVSDRDFAVEFCAAGALIMMHLSRFSEEVILWSSHEFRFITLDDGFSTGSSIMPQKKNPDVAELVRGKTGRVYGDLMGLLTALKGLPLAYNKDMQEDKEALFDAIDTVKKCLLVFAPMIETMKVNEKIMRQGVTGGFINATDAADYLAARNVPFRQAHEIVGRLVLYCEQAGKSLEELSMEELKDFSPLFGEDVYEKISPEKCVEARNVPGGPAPAAVKAAISKGRLYVHAFKER
ncbi:argininosuccinate lyase [Candidatus Formimonas warabiya]|uniref:Argininosuccinate lyase n=1 Tax=Formimonas warabiya TaxID=1761012 RepID=A0A3G1KXV3_FORW1|nr:argininosuccinate lyase [Candidatus Formimonas warabiya]ATW27271.1 argininosuccinate lyase [Candidatus Formimonas warabiya]